MNFKDTDIKITAGKKIHVIFGVGGNEFEVKEMKSLNGIKDNELKIEILKQTDFSIFGKYGLITNKLFGGLVKIEEVNAPFERYLAKDYFRDADEFEMEESQDGRELDYDSFNIYVIEDVNTNDIVGFIIYGNETEDDEEFYGLPEFKLALYPSEYFTDVEKMNLIHYLREEVKGDFLN